MNRTEARIKWEQMTGADQAEALWKMCISSSVLGGVDQNRGRSSNGKRGSVD